MSQTDPRAVAEQLIEQMGNYPGVSEHFRGEWLAYYKQDIEILATALADAERRGLERAAEIAMKKAQEPWKLEAANREGMRIAQAIRAQAQADKEG